MLMFTSDKLLHESFKRVKKTLTIGFFMVLQAAGSSAAERALRISYPAPSTSYLPLWAAKEAKLFERNNLSVELVSIGSSTRAIAALFSDDVDVVAGGAFVGVGAYLQGYKDLALFANINNKLIFSVYAQPSIANVSSLRGKRVGVTRFGGSLDFATRYFLKRSGLDPRKDVVLIQIASMPDIVAALVGKSIDAGTVSIPQNFLAQKLGFRKLADFSETDTKYALVSFLSKRKFLTDHRSQMLGFLKALIRGVHYVRTERREALKILSRYTRIDDMSILEPSYDFHVDKIWPRVPELQPEDLKLILEHHAETNPAAKEIDPNAFIYSQLVADVVKSGFVDQVYK
jgi:NitT/TauT family transport system substrate-binding protein